MTSHISKMTPKGKLPRVFISYTHESREHKLWVAKLATDLRNNGIDAILDQWECKLGTDFTMFMEKGIREADRVLLVCTPIYRRKADEGKGGVGYERLVVTAELAKNIQSEKFICVLRAGSQNEAIPTFAEGRMFVDLIQDDEYNQNIEELLRDIHQAPASPKPPVGPNPFTTKSPKIYLSGEAPPPTEVEKPPLGPNPFEPRKPGDVYQGAQHHRPRDVYQSITHRFDIAGHEGYIIVGLYEDGTPCAINIKMSKESSTIGGLLEGFSSAITLALQYGVPLEVLVEQYAHHRFEPSGFTKNPDIPIAKSIYDYVFRWIACQFIPGYREENAPR